MNRKQQIHSASRLATRKGLGSVVAVKKPSLSLTPSRAGHLIDLQGCKLTKTGIIFQPALSFENWQAMGETLRFMEGAVQFWIGDWINFGEKSYGETYAQALDATGLEYQTLADAAWVSSRVEFSRRRENVSFSHHREIASLLPDQQNCWLEIAEKDKLTREQLRQAIRDVKRQEIAMKAAKECPANVKIIENDFRKVEIPPDSIDLILTDPPYPAEFLPLWDDLAKFALHALKPSGFLVAYSGQLYLSQIIPKLSQHLTWYWLAGLHHLGPCAFRHERNTRNVMKPILIFQKPPIVKQPTSFGDLVESPAPSKELHEWGQSIEPLKKLIEAFSEPGEKVLDPFAGAGSTGVAAFELGRSCALIEIDPLNVKLIRGRFSK